MTIYAMSKVSIKLDPGDITPLSTANHYDQGLGRECSRARVALSKHPISPFWHFSIESWHLTSGLGQPLAKGLVFALAALGEAGDSENLQATDQN